MEKTFKQKNGITFYNTQAHFKWYRYFVHEIVKNVKLNVCTIILMFRIEKNEIKFSTKIEYANNDLRG